jgi:site-specific recombinase XerD
MKLTKNKPSQSPVMRRVKDRYLTKEELTKLFAALKTNRHGHRDHMLALVAFLHGLRVSELIDLRWDDVNWRAGTITIRRLKGSVDGVQYLEADEAKGLKRLQREQEPANRYIFVTERRQQFTRSGVAKMIETAGHKAGLGDCFPHMLRHAAGHALANGGASAYEIQKMLGHASFSNTIRYTKLNAAPLKDIWRGKR